MVEQMEFTTHWMKLIRFVGGMAMVSARELAGLPTEGCLQHIEAPTAMTLAAENLQTKRGVIDQRSYRKDIRTQTSDGVQNPSAVIVVSFHQTAWFVYKDVVVEKCSSLTLACVSLSTLPDLESHRTGSFASEVSRHAHPVSQPSARLGISHDLTRNLPPPLLMT
jgi:hypothetical protein